jgi:hypothetical protein
MLVSWNTSPPRLRVEEATLDVAAHTAAELDVVGLLADVCQRRRTTALRLLEALDARERIPRRGWLRAVLRDIADGTHAVLEHGYLVRVERAHGLPRGQRQHAAASGPTRFRDVVYPPYGLAVEPDGRLHHDSADARDADLDRDLDAAVDGLDTVRLGWGKVYGRPCRTAARIAILLRQRGWTGTPADPTANSPSSSPQRVGYVTGST